MELGALGYFLFGAALTIIFILIIKYYYKKDRKDEIEAAKYKMLDDEDEIHKEE